MTTATENKPRTLQDVLKELEGVPETDPIKCLQIMLDCAAEADPLLAATFAKPGKSVEECYSYLESVARSRGSRVCIPPSEALGIAIHYYDEDDIKVPKSQGRPAARKASADATLSKAEKEALKAEAAKAYKEACMAEEARRAADRKKAHAEKKAATAHAKPDHIQPVLFDFDELCSPETN